jgi:hypothetical protein
MSKGMDSFHTNVAKAGGLQGQGARCEAVVCYRDPLATPDLNASGFCNI